MRLSTQEIISCDKANYQCDGGYVNRVLNWGKRKGFVPEECFPYEGKSTECDEDHLTVNECRANNNVFKIVDYCLAQDEVGIKKEILKNGPVVAQMTIFTDFLTYKEGIYHRSEDAFKFNGQHVVKIVGWERQGEGNDYWIIENTFGEDWGELGTVRILASDKSTMLDFFAVGIAAYPYTMAEYYAMQDQMSAQPTQGGEDDSTVDLDSTATE